MKIANTIKLFETKDASLNFSLNYDFRRFIFGIAYTDGSMAAQVGMRMFVFHVAFVSFTVTSFFHLPAPPAPKNTSRRSATRKSGKRKRK